MMRITDEVKERLEEINRRTGRLTPDAVVADAKNKDSPLHALFEWDIKKAAEKHWIETARTIIGAVPLVIKHEHITIRAPFYVRDPHAKPEEQGYVSVPSLSNDHDGARIAIVNEFRRAADLLRRARHLATAIGLDREIDEIVSNIVELRSRVQHYGRKRGGEDGHAVMN
jgi:hypothetical protein